MKRIRLGKNRINHYIVGVAYYGPRMQLPLVSYTSDVTRAVYDIKSVELNIPLKAPEVWYHKNG